MIRPEMFLSVVAEAARRDLFPAAGVDLPVVPIQLGTPKWAGPGVDGMTLHAGKEAVAYYPQLAPPDGRAVTVAISNDFDKFFPGADIISMAATLVHELVHTICGDTEGHGARFAELMHKVWLEGAPESSVPSERFARWVMEKVVPDYAAAEARLQETLNA